MIKFGILLISTMLLFAPAIADAQPSPSTDIFSRGTEAFDKGQYNEALRYFQAAVEAGSETSVLHFNLGVTYFKLARYHEARREFEYLTGDQRAAPLAHYNLGRIALAIGDNATARRQFQIVFHTALNEKIRALAADRLRKLAPPRRARHWSGYLSVAGGYDDNVALDVGSKVEVGKIEDELVEYIGAVTGQLIGTRENGLRLRSTGYYRNYLDADEYDFGNLRIGPEIDRPFGKWNTSLSGYVDLSVINRDLFERILTAELRGSREVLPNLELNLEYQLSFVHADSPYEDLSGSRQRIMAEMSSMLFGANTRFGYTLELNDRDDPDYPTRHSVGFLVDKGLSDAWAAEATGSFRRSDYERSGRKDDRLWLGARISRTIPWGFSLFGKYEYIRNDSDDTEDNYTSNVFSLGLERFF